MKSHFRPLLFLLTCLALWLMSVQLMAQEQTPPANKSSGPLTTVMERMIDDQLPPEPLAPLAELPCIGGTAGSYPCSNVDLKSFMPLTTFGSSRANDIWGWTDPTNSKEYALIGLRDGTGFVDVTDPVNPIYLGKLPTHTSDSTWRDIKVFQNYAFIVSEASGHGMQVFDLTRLRSVTNPPVTFTEDAHYNGHGNAHNIVINEDTGYAYSVGTSTCSGGLHMINIQNPLTPTSAGCFSADGYTHDAQCVLYNGPDVAHVGQEICFNANEDSVTVVDVTNKAAPIQLARKTYAGSAYTHQLWLTEDQTYLLVDDELDEQSFGHNTRTYIWNVSDLDNPVLEDNYDAPVPSIDHNLYTVGNFAYQANYRSGLRIVDISDVENGNLTEVAYFDIYPSSNSANFNGAWSNYPFFESGNIVVSGIEQGLFILRPSHLLTNDPDLEMCETGSDSTQIDVTALFGNSASVALSTQELPSGAVATFNPNPVTAPGASQLTINASNVLAGSYPFTVLGSTGSVTHTLRLNLNIQTSNVTPPMLTSPADGTANHLLQPTFVWAAAAGALSYDLQVATDAAFTNIIISETGVIDTSYTPATPLDYNTTYYWRVRSLSDCANSNYSTTYSFTTEEAPPVTTQYLYVPVLIEED